MNTTDDKHGETAGFANGIFYGTILLQGRDTHTVSTADREWDLGSGRGESYLNKGAIKRTLHQSLRGIVSVVWGLSSQSLGVIL